MHQEDDNKCPICLEDLLYGCSEIGAVAPCGHVFHQTCFDSWAGVAKKAKVECPTCKFKCREFVRLYLSLLKPMDDDEEDEDEGVLDEDEPGDKGEQEVDHQQQHPQVAVCKHNPRRLKQKIQRLKQDVASLENVRKQYTELQGKYCLLEKDIQSAHVEVRQYQERQVCYERDTVQLKVELLKKNRQIQQMHKEKMEMERDLEQANEKLMEYKQKQERDNCKSFIHGIFTSIFINLEHVLKPWIGFLRRQ